MSSCKGPAIKKKYNLLWFLGPDLLGLALPAPHKIPPHRSKAAAVMGKENRKDFFSSVFIKGFFPWLTKYKYRKQRCDAAK